MLPEPLVSALGARCRRFKSSRPDHAYYMSKQEKCCVIVQEFAFSDADYTQLVLVVNDKASLSYAESLSSARVILFQQRE
jgi:hypothetical protein